jgi:hypothetical protein
MSMTIFEEKTETRVEVVRGKMNLIREDADKLPPVIHCLGMAYEIDRPEKGDSYLEQLVLEGKIEFRRGTSCSWMDENFKEHIAYFEHGKQLPKFDIIYKPGLEVEVKGFGHYAWRQRSQIDHSLRAKTYEN